MEVKFPTILYISSFNISPRGFFVFIPDMPDMHFLCLFISLSLFVFLMLEKISNPVLVSVCIFFRLNFVSFFVKFIIFMVWDFKKYREIKFLLPWKTPSPWRPELYRRGECLVKLERCFFSFVLSWCHWKLTKLCTGQINWCHREIFSHCIIRDSWLTMHLYNFRHELIEWLVMSGKGQF